MSEKYLKFDKKNLLKYRKYKQKGMIKVSIEKYI
jgi:hypothetical protein